MFWNSHLRSCRRTGEEKHEKRLPLEAERSPVRLSTWRSALLLASMFLGMGITAGFVAACGGSGGSVGGASSSDGGNPIEPNQEFECVGQLNDTAQPADKLDFPTAASPAPLACVPPDSGAALVLQKCQSKCDAGLAQFAAFIDQQDNLTGPSNEIIANDLTCTIEQTVGPLATGNGVKGCPNTDPPGLPEPLLSGGPSQYVADLSGDLSLSVATGTIVGTVTFNGIPVSGSIAYSIAPIDLNCPPAGCQLVISSLNLQAPTFTASESVFLLGTIFSDTVTGLTIQNVGWIAGTWQPGGQFLIPANTATAVFSFSNNGSPTSFDQPNANAITGTIDPVGGTVSFDPVTQNLGNTTATINPLSGANVSIPPIAVINVPTTVQCNETDAALVTLDGTESTDALGGPLHFYSWQVNGGPTLGGSTVQATLNLGTNNILFNVFNTSLAVGVAKETVTVVDTTPPVFAPLPATLTQTSCNPATQATVIPIPTATDICSPTVTVTGSIVSVNGVTLSTPIPVGSGSLSLPSGVYVIQWTATDLSGNVATATQTLTVRPGVEANGSISIDNDAVVQLPNGTPSLVANTGTGQVSIGVQATTGDVVTEGSVFLASRANVQGSIQAAGSLTEQSPVTVTGAITTGASVPLPAGPTLSGVVFPASFGAPIDLEPGVVQSLPPGAYASIAVKSRAVLTLSSGVYFVGSLDLEPQGILDLNQAAGPVQLFVQSSIIDRGQIQSISGAAGSFVLGYAGTSTFYVQSPFLGGTVIAPNADVVVSSLGANAFTGELFAQSYEVQPGATLTCDPVGSGLQQGVSTLSKTSLHSVDLVASRSATQSSAGSSSSGGGCSLRSSPPARGWQGVSLALLLGGATAERRWRRSRRRKKPFTPSH
jgi:hypothetical protein